MRTWRVGTFSMGATLIMLGICLLVANWFQLDVTYVMVSWWPIILIVLGVEILLYLIKAKSDKPFLKYDFLSIFFVGVLGTIGIAFSVLQTTGLMERAEELISREHHTFDLPALNHSLDKKINRIVVDTGNNPITVEGITSREISMFGSYEMFTGKKETLIKNVEDYVSLQQKGETVYVNIKEAPATFFGDKTTLAATLLVPQNVKLEVNGHYNEVTIKPRKLLSNWLVDRASSVSVQLQEKSDVLLTVADVQSISGEDEKWKTMPIKTDDNQAVGAVDETIDVENLEMPPIKSATYQVGKGTNHLEVLHADHVSLTNVK